MAGKVYFTSDLHFGHERLCCSLRGMSSEESDALIVERWNSIVDKRDKVYILGDITLDNPAYSIDMLSKLNGTKQIILGNHDGPKVAKKLVENGYKISASAEYKGYLLTHMPCHPDELKLYKGNIHGHIHNQELTDIPSGKNNPLEGMYFNANVEFNDFYPVLFDEIDYILSEK